MFQIISVNVAELGLFLQQLYFSDFHYSTFIVVLTILHHIASPLDLHRATHG